jgi:hypothetical protein
MSTFTVIPRNAMSRFRFGGQIRRSLQRPNQLDATNEASVVIVEVAHASQGAGHPLRRRPNTRAERS